MLSMMSIKTEFIKERSKKISLKKLVNSLLNDVSLKRDTDYYLREIWNTIIIDAKERTTPGKFYFEITSRNSTSLDLDFEQLLDGIATSKAPLIYFVELCKKLEFNYSELIAEQDKKPVLEKKRKTKEKLTPKQASKIRKEKYNTDKK